MFWKILKLVQKIYDGVLFGKVAANYIIKRLSYVFFCEILNIFQDTIVIEHLCANTSVLSRRNREARVVSTCTLCDSWKKEMETNKQSFTSSPNHICGALHDLVPFAQFKKREKHPWWSVNFSKVNFAKINTPPWVFFTFFKSYKWYQIAQRTTFVIHIYSRFFYTSRHSIHVVNFCQLLPTSSNRTQNNQKQTPEVFCRKGVFKNFSKFTGKHQFSVFRIIQRQHWP